MIRVAERLAASEEYPELTPLFVTGRSDENNGQVRQDTICWINGYSFIEWEYKNLFMRKEFLPDGKRDFRPDYIVKEEIYWNEIEPDFDVQFAIDDRLQVCRMWHRISVPVFRVGDPDATF